MRRFWAGTSLNNDIVADFLRQNVNQASFFRKSGLLRINFINVFILTPFFLTLPIPSIDMGLLALSHFSLLRFLLAFCESAD